jgi:hypothetical protein
MTVDDAYTDEKGCDSKRKDIKCQQDDRAGIMFGKLKHVQCEMVKRRATRCSNRQRQGSAWELLLSVGVLALSLLLLGGAATCVDKPIANLFCG